MVSRYLDSAQRPDVADWVGPLVDRTLPRVFGGLPPVEVKGRVRLEPMAEDVHSATGHDHLRQRPSVLGIDDAHHGTQGPMGDPGLGPHLQQVEDRHAGRLAAGAGRGWDSDQRL